MVSTIGSADRIADHGEHTVNGSAEAQLWTCGMHPNVIQDEPGTCPICQMDLVPLRPRTDPAAAETPPRSGPAPCTR